jgi:hypothetical protein
MPLLILLPDSAKRTCLYVVRAFRTVGLAI